MQVSSPLTIESRLISSPGDFRFDLKRDRNDDETEYNFKKRFLKARKIPTSFIKEDDYGGYIVLSRKRKHFFSLEVQKYHVYKTKDDVWICTCMDFSNFLKPCKHILKVVLYKNRIPEEKQKLDELIHRAINSPKRMVEYDDTDFFI